MKKKVIGLKIDVDTYRGMRDGVPRLLQTLKDFNIKGSFYLRIGPDASGLAMWQIVRNPRFLQKMLTSNAVGMYGIKTALYGTLLASPLIALSFPQLIEEMLSDGHDLQFHAWDHRRWQDSLASRSEKWIAEWFSKGIEGFESLTGKKPRAFGAPGWMIDERVVKLASTFGFSYLSCTRAQEPFIHLSNGLVEIPSDLPCFEEVGLKDGAHKILRLLNDERTHIFPVHAEVEGGVGEEEFRKFLQGALQKGFAITTVDEIFSTLGKSLPLRDFRMELLAGRAFPCAV
ncbi:MAG: polysaccharide deacetylase family protein [Deltaproteobacteria bacterium]|nr:polysaccharide deacetylase family protein [Deltaproteobacteria bacterium]